jgi:hypothetical protein
MVGLLESTPSGVVWRCGHWITDKEGYQEIAGRRKDMDENKLARWKMRIEENPHLPYHTTEDCHGEQH